MPDEALEDGVIPETSLALLAHADGQVEMRVPCQRVHDDTVPPAWMVLAHVFAVKLRDPAWVHEMLNESRELIDAQTTNERMH